MAKKPISEILKEARKKHGLSAKFVCDHLGVADGITLSPPTLYGYENGHRKPTPETLFALCDLYDLDDILVQAGYASGDELDKDDEELATLEDILLTTFYGLNRKGQKEAIKRTKELSLVDEYQAHTSPQTDEPQNTDNLPHKKEKNV